MYRYASIAVSYFLIAFKLVQKFKADSERIGLVGIAVHLIVTVGISHHYCPT